MSWIFLRLFERNRAENFLKAVPSLILSLEHLQIPLGSNLLHFPGSGINYWKLLKTLFCHNPSVCPGRLPLVSLFSLPYSSPAPHASHTPLQTKCLSWVSGSPRSIPFSIFHWDLPDGCTCWSADVGLGGRASCFHSKNSQLHVDWYWLSKLTKF